MSPSPSDTYANFTEAQRAYHKTTLRNHLIADRIPVAHLGDLLRAVDRETVITLETETEPDMRKTDNPYFGRATKRSLFVGYLLMDYAAAVNQKRIDQGLPADFIPGPRPWGQRVGKSPLIEHKDVLYLEVISEGPVVTEFFVDGKRVQREVLEPWLRSKPDAPVRIACPKLSSIREITLHGRWYTLTSQPPCTEKVTAG